ncbi:MAG: hypothetical protein SVZ03_15375 [Spirochaetota bacterium]|nr:hypothetical protein [Spirochaetota bacterium]
MITKRVNLSRIKSSISSIIICFLILPFCVTVCNNDNSGSNIPLPPPGGSGNTTVTPDGGTVTDPSGASVSIPPGALTESVDISIKTYSDNSSLPPGWCPVPGLAGVVEFGPDGLTFQKPVTVTIPASNPMTPGEKFPLLLWESESDTVVQTGFIASVNADGNSFSAEVTHFCGYGGIDVNYLIEGGDPETFLDLYVEWYMNGGERMRSVADFIKLGDKRAKNNECWEVVGLDFILDWEINGQRDGIMKRVGRSTDNADAPLIMIAVDWDISDGNSMSVFIQLTIVAYYDCTAPEMTVNAAPPTVAKGDMSEVTSTLLCEGTPMVDKVVQFEVSSGPGDVTPETASTSSNGKAQVTFIAEDDDAVVKATHEACMDDTPKSITGEQKIKIVPTEFTLDISYDQTMEEYCVIYDTIVYSGSIPFSVTAINPDGSGNLDGQGTCMFGGDGQGYDPDDCSVDCTWTKEGEVEFTITGTLIVSETEDPKLELTLSPNFDTTMTLYCPDEPPLTYPYMVGGEPYTFTIPMEDGYTIDHQEQPSPQVNTHITYVLHILD